MQSEIFLDEFQNILSVELFDSIKSIHEELLKLNYTKHIDVLDNYFEGIQGDTSTIKADALVLFKGICTEVINLHGIQLIDGESITIPMYDKMITSLVTLGQNKIYDIIDPSILEDPDDTTVFTASVFSAMTELNIEDFLEIIEDVDTSLVELLESPFTADELGDFINARFRERLLNHIGDDRSGLAIAHIKETGQLGFRLDDTLFAYQDELNDLKDNELIEELKRFALASSLPEKHFAAVITEVLDDLIYKNERIIRLMATIVREFMVFDNEDS